MLKTVDLSKTISDKEYRIQLVRHQLELRRYAYELYRLQKPMIIVYEGWDAAGKGGSIRRLTEKLDPRGYHVYSIGAPEGDDKNHHYLWRFWRRLIPPDEKQVVIFDRSWYGRVMVERVEGFATEREWRRAYREINEFERQLVDSGTILAKFWLHISAEQQLHRFEARRDTPHKRWKLTEEDWRNRQRWAEYSKAVEMMLVKTSTRRAPWTIVEANDKHYARVKTLRKLSELLAQKLGPLGDLGGFGKKNKKKRKNSNKD
jgi:polyphosphate kinase 2 (PPK2 family)